MLYHETMYVQRLRVSLTFEVNLKITWDFVKHDKHTQNKEVVQAILSSMTSVQLNRLQQHMRLETSGRTIKKIKGVNKVTS